MGDHTRAKAMEKLEVDVALIRIELSDLQSLKSEVRQLQSEMITASHLDSKIQEIQSSMDKSLMLILQSINPSTTRAPAPPEAVTTGEKPSTVQTPVLQNTPISPLNLQTVFDRSLNIGSKSPLIICQHFL